MTRDARAALNAYKREWRKKNPDKVREANARYWERVAAKEKEKNGEKNTEER